jgi:hypothetical protein
MASARAFCVQLYVERLCKRYRWRRSFDSLRIGILQDAGERVRKKLATSVLL